ncbi:hypothetical protein EJB05_05006, partial [Eragrostis curvula]
MEPLEVAITIIFDALLLVFMVKLFFAMFQMKLVVILFYLVILLFAMAFSGRAPMVTLALTQGGASYPGTLNLAMWPQ